MPGNPLGIALSRAVQDYVPESGRFAEPPERSSPPPGLSKGQLILGVLADALAGAQGRPGAFAAQMGQQRQQEREEAQWSRRRQQTNDDWTQREQWKLEHPEPAPMLRDAQAWATMTPEQRTAYGQMRQAGAGDPDVFITLPNKQVYVGPKSGLAAAMMGGAPSPPRPVGRLTPIPGGPAPGAPATFR